MSDATGTRRSVRSHLDVGPGRATAALAALCFWCWLLARWLNDWVFADRGIGPGRRQPFFSPEPLSAVSDVLARAATALGPVGAPIDWLAGLVELAAVATGWLPALADGAWLTLVLTVAGMAFGFLIAVPLSVARVYGRGSAWLSLAYTELIRGTPLLAQLFVLYYGLGLTSWLRELPFVGLGPIPDQAVWVAIIGFTINSAAYQAEYIRSALLSVESGQLTAARSVGLSKLDGIRFVVLPQALRYAIPGWTNELVYLIKYSSLAYFITVLELFGRASEIGSRTFEYTAVFTVAALVYLGFVLSASYLMGRVEAHVAIPGLGQPGTDRRKRG